MREGEWAGVHGCVCVRVNPIVWGLGAGGSGSPGLGATAASTATQPAILPAPAWRPCHLRRFARSSSGPCRAQLHGGWEGGENSSMGDRREERTAQKRDTPGARPKAEPASGLRRSCHWTPWGSNLSDLSQVAQGQAGTVTQTGLQQRELLWRPRIDTPREQMQHHSKIQRAAQIPDPKGFFMGFSLFSPFFLPSIFLVYL